MGDEWSTYKIGDLGRVVTGKTPSTKISENFVGEYPFITIPDLGNRVFIDSSERTLSVIGASKMKSLLLPPNSVMMSCIATIGKCGITKKPSFTNQQINSVICNLEIIDPLFLYYTFTQLGHELEAAGGGGSVYTNVSKSRFSEISVSLPPLPEQRLIAGTLGALDDKIELNRRMNRTLESMARGVFRQWFVESDDVGSWEVGKLGEVADVNWGDTSTTKSSYVENGYPAYSAKGQDGYLSYYDFDRTGIVVSAIGANSGATWLALGKWSCIKNTLRFWATSDEISTEYLFYATLGNEKWPLRGSAQPFIAQGDAREMKIVIPPNKLAIRFAETVSPMIEMQKHNEKESRTLASLRDSLLPKLMRGEVRVKDL